ncbi:MAG: hypothetical protein Q9218_001498 [Villophora microphyllina]
MVTTMYQRTLGVLLVFASSIIFLFAYRSHSLSALESVQNRPRAELSVVDQLSTTANKSIAVPFGNQQQHSPIFSVQSPHSLAKRDVLTFERAFCRGNDLYQRVQAVYRGERPSNDRTFTQDDIDDGWKNAGSQATNGVYTCQYIRSAAAIIAIDTKSPQYQLGRKGIAKEQALDVLPKLNRFSDMAWTMWSDVVARNEAANGPVDTFEVNKRFETTDPGRLRYIGRDAIINDDTEAIMQHIFRDKGEGSLQAPYPGHTFSMDQREGLALLGTPNGGGTAYLLMDRLAVLGKRKPTVTIWTHGSAGWLCMVWNLEDP